jgi:predicted Rossmann-fold nucleotide-binding protein
MGAVANATLAASGDVTGVMPKAFVDCEIAHMDHTRLRVVGSMRERKAIMSELSEGSVALSGGTGTLEGFFEVLS